MEKPLNIFYEEPETDRWSPFDRYPRRIARRIVRGKPQPGGQMRVYLNLCAGLDCLGIPYRVNDYRYIRQNTEEVACIIGKPHVLDKISWKNPILFGASVFSHPIEDPELFNRLPVRKVLVPGEWMRKMWEPYYGEKVRAWPVGIDTDKWSPSSEYETNLDFLLYDKVRWEHDRYERELINPIQRCLDGLGLSFRVIRYGFYREKDFHRLLRKSRAMIFLCEHETQGIAYQQALSSEVPILAWDRGGLMRDPFLFPYRVQYEPVTSVPFWDERCGLRFKDMDEFPMKLEEFLSKLNRDAFAAREYILENLTLEKCAQDYVRILNEIR